MKRTVLMLLLCGALLTTAACTGPADDPPTPATGTGADAAPSSTADPAASTAENTTPAPVTTTAGETTATAVATLPPTPVKGELGTPSFTLEGQTFTMGEAPDRLLAFLGEPKETFSYGDNLYDGTDHFYHYKDLWVTAFQPTGSEKSVLTDVYFITDKYTVDGIGVGSSAADLRRTVALPESDPEAVGYPKFCYQEFLGGTEIGGWGYRLDREQETPGNTYWAFLFTYEDDPRAPADEAPILCIHIYCVYPTAQGF